MATVDATGLSHALHDHPDAAVCVGFSGGLDSTVLLHLLAGARHGAGLRALHVHHGLHPQADAWADHCRRTCEMLGVPLTVAKVKIERDGRGLEAAARAARHAAFEAALVPGEVLALAHHRDDQAETLLLRALRASGPEGLAAMRRWREFGHARLWRPLLDQGRQALAAYADAHGLRWIDDPSNIDTAYDRNFLRQQVLPLLRERWPHADAALAQSASRCADAGDLLAESDLAALAGVATADPHCLSRSHLAALPPPRRARVLRTWTARLGLPPLPAHAIAHIELDVLGARADAEAEFSWHGAIVRSWRDLLYAGVARPPLPQDWRSAWDGRAPLALPQGGVLKLEGIDGFGTEVIVGARQGGERLVLPGRRHSHSLKHVLQELGVPPWVRERMPLLSDADGRLLAVADLAYSAEFDAWLRECGAWLRWDEH
jgi:tRNA(Ile)-lysidine synthase